jgi:hypothetical protein
MLILIAVWEFITAFVSLIGIFAIALFAFPAMLGMWGNNWGSMWGMGGTPMIGGVFGLSIAILVLLCYLAVAITAGIGLLMGQEWGRVTGLVHSALSLIFPPVIGTVLGTLSIIYLTKTEVKDYFAAKQSKA